MQGRLAPGPGHRPRHLRLHRQRQVPRRVPRQRLGAEARQEPHPEHLEPHRRAGEPAFDPNREYSLPWFSGMDGIAWNEDVTGPVTTVKQLLEDPKLKGKVGVWSSDGRHARPHHARATATTRRRSPTSRSTGRSPTLKTAVDSGSDPQVLRQRLRAAALERATSRRRLAWSGDIAQPPATRSSSGSSRRRAGSSGPTTCSSRSEAACPTASTYMNFVYDPEIAAQLALGANYISAVKGVKEEAAKLNPKAVDEHARLPDRRDARADAPERPGDVQQRRTTSTSG